MANDTTQNFANHTKFDPPFHFFLAPLLLINLGVAIFMLIRHFSLTSGWHVVLSIVAVAALLKMRIYSLKVQDRLIRLEERLRLSGLLNEPLRSRIGELTPGQLVAIRFASDAECPALVEKTLAGNLRPKEIKQSVGNWRADHFRV